MNMFKYVRICFFKYVNKYVFKHVFHTYRKKGDFNISDLNLFGVYEEGL